MAMLGYECRDTRVPLKLRKAEEDAITKPPEVKINVVRNAFAVISSRFPSEVSLQDLHVFVKTHDLGISLATLRDMVGKARAKRRDWRAHGRDLPVRVMRDTLWVEDVVWALRVRKTRREFDKWEVNEHRGEWVAILEAGTPDNPTVFAAPADHRTAPPLSYTELLEEAPFIVSPKTATSPPASGGFSSHGGGSSERRFGRGGGASTESRPSSTGRVWASLESRAPSSLLLTSRPGSATAGDPTATATVSATEWGGEGGVGDSTILPFPMGWDSISKGDSAVGVSGGIAERGSMISAQERGLFGRKPSPMMVARSSCYAPRRRPLCSVDGRRPRPETANEDALELYEIEDDINTSGFGSVASDFATTAAPQRRSENRCDVVACSSLTSTLAVGDGASLPDTDGVEAGIGNKAKNSHTVNSTGPTTKAPDIDSTNINSSSNSSNAVVVFGGNSRSEIDQTSVFGSKHGGYRSRLSISPLPHPQDIGRLSPVGSTSNPMDPNSSLAASESCRSSARAERGAGARAGGVEFVEGMSTGGFDNDARLLPGWDNHSEEEEEGSVVAEWWRDALTPSSRRPITRRSLVGGTAENSGCIWGLEGRKGSEGGVGYWTRDYGGRPATAPTCDFSTESKQRGLEGCLQRRSSLNELEGLASVRVRESGKALARVQSRTLFSHMIGRNTTRNGFDRSLKEKARETLTLDLRGHGIHLVAPETSTSPRVELPPPRPGRSAVANAWSSDGQGVGGGRCLLLKSRPPPFQASRSRTLQEDRVTVAIDQADMWGKCAQAHFSRFAEKPYVHSFRPHTSHGRHDFGSTQMSSNALTTTPPSA